MAAITLYDTTLRDGTQMEGISLSVEDKLKIAVKLDELGIHFIEGGWPGSNPKDDEFFRKSKSLKLKHSLITAFGSTRKVDTAPSKDLNLKALIDSQAPIITIVGKASETQVKSVLETSLEENLNMIRESVQYLKEHGRRVFFDAEHFFDGYLSNPDYALASIRAAENAGAEYIVLCDTNGGTLPGEIQEIVGKIAEETSVPLGIHCHNDSEMAVANSLAAVQAGVSQIQGTINGYGERCGNTNLLSIIANLKLKLGVDIVTDEQLETLTEVHRYVSEIANMPPNRYQAYVGSSAFSHKGGLHASAMVKDEHSYQHVAPETVGNTKHIVVSELAGRSNITVKLEEHKLASHLSKAQVNELLNDLKARENQGYQYEGAEASFDLLVRRNLPGYKPPFELVDFLVVMEKRRRQSKKTTDTESLAEAMVKVQVNDSIMHTVAEGNGPVNALDAALRKALLQAYPHLQHVHLTDYKVRVVEKGESGTASNVRVIVESTDGNHRWSTVGASGNIIEASWQALTDSMEYALLEDIS